MIDSVDSDLWLDSSKNSGSYYNQFPTDNKDYCEINLSPYFGAFLLLVAVK